MTKTQPFRDGDHVPLRAIIDDPDLALDADWTSVPAGADRRPIRWAHISELREPGPYLLGGELLLTAGVDFPTDAAEVHAYVLGIRDAEVSALGFGLTPPMHTTVPPELRRACARYGLPLLIVPPETPFLAISRSVALAITRRAQQSQRRISDARETLTSAAGRGPDEVIRELGHHLRAWTVLIGPDNAIITEHRAPQPLPDELHDLLRKLRAATGNRSATTELADATFVLAQPVAQRDPATHLLVVGRDHRWDDTDRTVVSVAAALLKVVGRADPEVTTLSAVLTAFLVVDSDRFDPLRRAIGSDACRVVLGIHSGRSIPESDSAWLRSRLNTPLVRLTQRQFVAITATVPSSEVLDQLHDTGWLSTVSSPVALENLPDAVAELEMLRHRTQHLGHPLVADAEPLGVDSLLDPASATRFAGRILAPILRMDQHRDSSLVTTLRVWLAQHGNWDRSAAALGVHRNSVRHRIGQVERALDVDLADAQTRMELWFALRWIRSSRSQ